MTRVSPLILRSATVAGLVLASAASAQLVDPDPGWREAAVPPPPVFDTRRLVPVEMPADVGVRMGVDPESLTIGADGVVRYVVVAQGLGGAVNAMYEGIRCSTFEFRRYARSSADGRWRSLDDDRWQRMSSSGPSPHPFRLAREGMCQGAAAPTTVREILEALRLTATQRAP